MSVTALTNRIWELDGEPRLQLERLLDAPYTEPITPDWIQERLESLTLPQLCVIGLALENALDEAPEDEEIDSDGWGPTGSWVEEDYVLDDEGRDFSDPFFGWIEDEDGNLHDPLFCESPCSHCEAA